MRNLRSAHTLVALFTLTLSTLCLAQPDRITEPIAPRASNRLTTGVPLQAKRGLDQGAVDPSLKLSVTLLTVPSAAQQKALDQLLGDQQNPNSPSYHQWLTPEQYADRFGLSPNDARKIAAWLQSQGFTVLSTARGRNWIVFSATAAQVQHVFQTEIHYFKVNGEKRFSNTAPPSIPAALSGIVTGFRGLNNFPMKSNAKRYAPGYTITQASKSYFFLAPGDVAAIYDINNLIGAGTNGTGQKLAVVGQTDVYLDDLANFRSGFSINAITGCATNSSGVITGCSGGNFDYIFADEGTDPGSPDQLGDDLPEADLDLEWSNAVARDATIVFVNAPNTGVSTAAYYAIDNDVAPVITMSYTTPCELAEIEGGTFTADEAEFKKANSEGITFFNSSGDTGAAECDNYGFTFSNTAQYGYAVAYPASSPEVTGVGGTSIPVANPDEYTSTFWNPSNDANGDGGSAKGYIPEQAWNDSEEFGYLCTAAKPCTLTGNDGNPYTVTSWETAQAAIGIVAGGGGVSNCISINTSDFVCTGGFAQPAWQSGITLSSIDAGSAGVVTTPARYTPDVSLIASANFPGYIVCTAQSELGLSANTSICTGGATGIQSMLSTCLAGTGPCSIFGGTSVASPIMAGIATLLNQYVVAKGVQTKPGLGNINPMLYKIAESNSTNKAFNLVDTPNTGAYSDGAFCAEGTPSSGPAAIECPSTGTNAGFLGFDTYNVSTGSNVPSYNLATGLGSVDAGNLFTAWVAEASTFSLSANPTTLSIADGSQNASIITVTSMDNFNSAVALTASGQPSGVTVSFNPTPVTPPANSTVTSTMTVAVGATVAAGTSTITVTGTSGSTTATTTVTLTVTAGPSFTLSAAPTSVSIAQGQSNNTASTITVTSVSGFNSAVALTASGMPAGVTASLTPTSVTPPTNSTVTSTLKLTVGASATPGTYAITVTGTSGSLTATATVSLTVTAPFSVSASALSGPIAQKTSGITSTITVTSSSGFSSAVGLSVTNLPAGVSGSFSPTSVTPPANGTATSTLTLAVSPSVVPGTYSITITGTSGSINETTTLSLTVVQGINVSITIQPPEAYPGQSTLATVQVTTEDSQTFANNVSFACPSSLPAGVTCTAPPPITAGSGNTGSANITLTTAGPFSGNASSGATHRTLKQRSGNRRLWLPLSLPLAGIMLVGLAGKRIPRVFQILGLCLVVAFAGFLIACGGSSSSPPVVTVTPSSASMYPNLVINGQSGTEQTATFTASVSNTTSQTVTWAVNGTAGGSSTVGTISSSGVYTAPATNPGTAIAVTATSSSTSTPGSATVTLETPTGATPVGSPDPITIMVTEGSVTQTATLNLNIY